MLELIAANIPVPRDLDLPLPLDSYDLKIFLVVLFLAHIFFVNLMVGGSILTVTFEIIGRKLQRFDNLAKKIAETITVNKSLAVVLGVGPLLCISLVYTIHFYSANAITGYAWILIVPFVTLAFLLTYVHKYTWHLLVDKYKTLHIMIGAAAVLLFLTIPLIFLSNINLMLFPDKWQGVTGFFSSLQVGNVFPRYFHFLTASLAFTGLFLSWWFGRKKFPVDKFMPGFTNAELRRMFYKVTFYVTIGQLFFGLLLLFTLPSIGYSTTLFIIITCGAFCALIVLHLLYLEIRSDNNRIGRLLIPIVGVFTVLILLMGTGRHVYRETSLADHNAMIADATATFHSIQYATKMRLDAGLSAGEAIETGPTGKSVFKNCAACHAVNKVLAAPALTEVYSIYKDNPEGIVKWAKNPGKKRPEFAPMPSFAHLGDQKLQLVADYILQLGKGAKEKQ